MSGYRIRTIPTGVGCRVSGGNSPRKGWRNNRPGHSGRYVFWGRSRILTPIHAIAICAMLDMLASSNTWLAPATAYCREATRETVNQFAQGSGARQPPTRGCFVCGDCRNAYELYAHQQLQTWDTTPERLSPAAGSRYPNVPALRRTSRPSGSTHVGSRIRRHRAPILPPCVTATCRTTSMSM
jgi:hypothetical protein